MMHSHSILVIGLLFGITATAHGVVAQDSLPPNIIPGSYAAGVCRRASFPAILPALDSVLDSVGVATRLKAMGVVKRMDFGLRLGALRGDPPVHLIGTKGPDSLAPGAVTAVQAGLRPVPPDRPWAFRLQVEGEKQLQMKLERSEVCAAKPPPQPRKLASAIVTVERSEVDRMARDIERTRNQRRIMKHRVLLDGTGRILALQLEVSSGDPSMDAAEATAIRTWTFSGSTLDGLPVTGWIELRGNYGF
jgi:hypothetical protein